MPINYSTSLGLGTNKPQPDTLTPKLPGTPTPLNAPAAGIRPGTGGMIDNNGNPTATWSKPPAPLDPNNVAIGQGPKVAAGQDIPNPNATTRAGQTYSDMVFGNAADPNKNVSEFGNIADQKLMQQLKTGNIPGNENLRGNAERQNSLNLSGSTQAARDAAVRAGLNPNDPGFAKAVIQAQAGAQGQNIDRNLGVADMQNKAYQGALDQARGVESTNQGKQQTSMAQLLGLDTNQYNKNQTAYTQGETARLETKNDQNTLINSVTDPKTKNILTGVAAAGGNVQETYNKLLGLTPDANGNINAATGGTINSGVASQTPGAATAAGILDEVKNSTPRNPGETDAAYNQRVQDIATKYNQQAVADKYAPLKTIDTQTQVKDLKDALATGKPLTPEQLDLAKKENVIPVMNSSGGGAGSIAGKGNAANYLKDHPDGKAIIDGVPVTVVGGARYTNYINNRHYNSGARHTDTTQIKYNGKDYWLDTTGNWFDKDPMTMQKNGELSATVAKEKSIANPLKG